MAGYRYYDDEETRYIEDHWGNIPLRSIKKKCQKRTMDGIIGKARRLNLRGVSKSGESLNISQIAKMFGVDRKTIKNKWKNAGLKIIRRVLRTRKEYLLVQYSDLLDWLESHTELWDSRKLGFFALGVEPDWLTAKRNQDNNIPKRAFQNYSKEEDSQIWYLSVHGYTPVQIADLMGRSKLSVMRRLDRIRIEKFGSKE